MRKYRDIEFLGRKYSSCLWLASGTYGWGLESVDQGFAPGLEVGALVTKGVSPEEMDGAPQPRIAEVEKGIALLNAIGLQNPGVDHFIHKYFRRYQKEEWPSQVWINVFAGSVTGYLKVMEKILEAYDPSRDSTWFAGFELNVSCPNVDKGGAEFANDNEALGQLLVASKKLCKSIPLMVKLSPLVNQPIECAKRLEGCGADALSISNTLLAGLPDVGKGRWVIGRRYAGMSGPALKPLALRIVDQVASKVNIPICGIGGVRSAQDVQEFLDAGAQVVQIGTANFSNPWVAQDIFTELHSAR